MNERIKELAKAYLVHERYTRYGEIVEEDLYEFYPDELEKFAQLIVEECATAITEDALAKDCGTFMMDSYAKGMRYSAHLIKEHFGVE
jgi:hypothetical protein